MFEQNFDFWLSAPALPDLGKNNNFENLLYGTDVLKIIAALSIKPVLSV